MKKIISTLLAFALALTVAMPLQTSEVSAATAPKATTVTSITHIGTTLKLQWKSVSKITGYEIQYGTDSFFMNTSSLILVDSKTTSKTIKNISSTKLYYARVRTYLTDSKGKKTYSDWAYSSNCKLNKTATITPLNKSGKLFELRDAAGETVGKFDTLQGGCTYGSYGWFVLYNRNVTKCKIVKINMNTMAIVKVSDELRVSHGSDLAYNPNKNQLVVAHGPSNYKKISIINPTTLTLVKTQELTLPKGTAGATAKNCSNFKGVTAFTYNVEHKCYVGRLKSQGHIIMYDDNFKATRYVRLDKKDNQLFQGMDSFDDYILVGQSFSKGKPYNIISVYDWNGNYLKKINVTKSYEMETVFHREGKLYAGFYRSYYKTYYIDDWKIKVTTGGKNKVKTKLKVTRLQRDGYFYKIGNI